MTRIDGSELLRSAGFEGLGLELPGEGVLHLGIDIGSVSCKLALLDDNFRVHYACYQRTQGRPLVTAQKLLGALFNEIPADRIGTIVGTGSAGRSLCELLGIDFVNELICQAAAIRHLHPEVRTLIEMGGQDSKVVFLSDPSEPGDDTRDMVDFSVNTNCAAGTGSFLDQQASRLGVSIEGEFGDLALQSEVPPRVAGRCSVFAKSDMIHLQQVATPVHDIVAGLCLGLARNLKSSLCQGKEVIRPIGFCGGVASNAGVIRALEEVFELGQGGLIVPRQHAVTGAIGAVLIQLKQGAGQGSMQEPRVLMSRLDDFLGEDHAVGYRLKPLGRPSIDAPASKVHDDVVAKARARGVKIPAYLGIDVGSISTNVVVMDAEQQVLSKAYLMTASRPLEAVRQGLDMVGKEVADVVEIVGAATTGSGRYLTGDFVGADLVINEITAQANGAAIVDSEVDTIFEIGGQDSKYISLDHGVVVDFEMNHACAAGTGSFIEEQAERLDISIKGEFAAEAFKSDAPIRLGERCTVFMESDLLSYQQQGAERPDLVAGLSYSIVTNYLNRVVAHRKIGRKIFFQGGTAFNRAVVAAFETVTGKPIVVPDHHEVTGALGAAELARRHMVALREGNGHGLESKFRGFDLSQLEYEIRSFECEKCSNNCEIKEVKMPGSDPLFYGSRCDIYNVKKDDKKGADLPDLFRERQELLESFGGLRGGEKQGSFKKGKTVGIPMCLSNYQFLPLWSTFFQKLGYEVVSSGRSSKKVIREGVEAVLSQMCFPIKVAHGHVLELVHKEVDFIWLPSIVSMAADFKENKHNQLCPYVQTIPYQIRVALAAKGIELKGERNHLLDIHVRFQEGEKVLLRTLCALVDKLGVSKAEIKSALASGLAAQKGFEDACRARGREVLDNLGTGKKACVLVSRPYNGCDPGISLDLPRKLRKMDVLALPMDFLDFREANITEPELQELMYWKYGQRIMRAAHIIRDDARLYAIYVSNFSCGPDSFIITLFKELMVRTDGAGDEIRKPALVLEIDEHSADAGVVTRLEAFHESLKSVEGRLKKADSGKRAVQDEGSPWKCDWTDCSNRTLYVPWMGDQAYGVAAAFRHCGQKAQVLPVGDEESLRWGRQYTTGKECLPCIITTGDMLKVVKAEGFDADKAAFFMPGSSGPCRFGQYSCLQRLVLKQVGMPQSLPVISPNQDSNFYQTFKRFGKDPTRLAFDGIAAIDLLYKILLKVRPYEISKGQADKVYEESLRRVEQEIERGISERELAGVLGECARRFKAIEVEVGTRRPLVSVVGEIYVRSHRMANDNIVRKLEALGAEVNLASLSEWLYYTNFTRMEMAKRWRSLGLFGQNYLKNSVQRQIERRLSAVVEKYYPGLQERPVKEVIAEAEPYMHVSFEGEAILSIGKIMEMWRCHGAAGGVNVMPFSCMPSTVVSSITRQMSEDAGGLPIISINYDGQQDPTLQTRLEAFIHQVQGFAQQQSSAPAAVH